MLDLKLASLLFQIHAEAAEPRAFSPPKDGFQFEPVFARKHKVNVLLFGHLDAHDGCQSEFGEPRGVELALEVAVDGEPTILVVERVLRLGVDFAHEGGFVGGRHFESGDHGSALGEQGAARVRPHFGLELQPKRRGGVGLAAHVQPVPLVERRKGGLQREFPVEVARLDVNVVPQLRVAFTERVLGTRPVVKLDAALPRRVVQLNGRVGLAALDFHVQHASVAQEQLQIVVDRAVVAVRQPNVPDFRAHRRVVPGGTHQFQTEFRSRLQRRQDGLDVEPFVRPIFRHFKKNFRFLCQNILNSANAEVLKI
jgi:hypothetical protein